MVDGHIKDAPKYTGGMTKEEKEEMKKMKDAIKAKKK